MRYSRAVASTFLVVRPGSEVSKRSMVPRLWPDQPDCLLQSHQSLIQYLAGSGQYVFHITSPATLDQVWHVHDDTSDIICLRVWSAIENSLLIWKGLTITTELMHSFYVV